MESARVVVVGGGISGIAAVRHLIRNGINDVTLLEARERVGGRINTVNCGDGYLEMGAQWIHGEGENPLYLLAEKNGLVADSKFMEELEDKDDYYFLENGKTINTSFAEDSCDILDSILEEANKYSREHASIPTCMNDSMGKFFRQRFDTYLQSCGDSAEDILLKERIYQWKCVSEKVENGSDSMDDLSLYAWGEYLEYDGEEAVEMRAGYQPILDALMVDIPKTCIHTNAEVCHINWEHDVAVIRYKKALVPHSSDLNIKTSTSKHSDEEEYVVIAADHVIVTCPIGYLKDNVRRLFTPQLPQAMTDVIDVMGFGTVNKIFLEFETAFWDENTYSMNLMWPTTNRSSLFDGLDPKVQEEMSWVRGILSFDVVQSHPSMLCGWVAGAKAVAMEMTSDAETLRLCHMLLEHFTGRKVPLPSQIYRTRWHSDPLTRGSYSFIRPGSTAAVCDTLAEPLPSSQNPQLLLAGEASYRTSFSTTHAAFLSGERAAQIVLDSRTLPHTTQG